MPNKKGTVVTVQWLRGVAALMVVFHHALQPVPWLFNPIKGYEAFGWGVDVFFVISGFIMYVAARSEPPSRFIWLRIVRVVPLYWLATIGLFVLFYKAKVLQLSLEEARHLALSLLFIPHYSLSKPDQIWPFLIPGWTLNYEMFFYVVFLIALLFRRPLLVTSVCILSFVLLGFGFDFSGHAILLTYTNPLLLEFIAGVWVGRLYVMGKLRPQWAFLLPLGFLGLMSIPLLIADDQAIWLRAAFSACILVGAVSFAHDAPKLDVLTKIGDASYSIYLTHTMVGLVISRKIFAIAPVHGWLQFLLFILVSLFLSTLSGYFVFKYVERPMLNWMRPQKR